MMDIDINTDTLRGIASFLVQNEQYGDDWTEALAELYKVIDYIDAKNGHYYFPPYETILNICLEDMTIRDTHIISLPLGYHIKFIRDNDDSIWAEFYDKDDDFVKRLLFWDKLRTEEIRQAFEYHIDHFYDNIL